MGGDDGNDGRTAETPVQTLGALEARIADGIQINLARGSFWEETLDTAGASAVVIDDYGDPEAPMPKIDTTNVASAGAWTLTPGTTKTYQITWPHSIASATSFLRIWEDGEALTFGNSSNLDVTPGSCWYSGMANANNPLTVYLHPKGSTDPTSDGKTYRISARDHAICLGARSIVRDIYLDKNCHNDGLVSSARIGCKVERCVLHWGGKHHSVLQADAGGNVAWIGVICYRQIPTPSQWGGGQSSLTAFRNSPAGGDITFDGCVVYAPNGGAGGLYSHTAGSGSFGHVVERDCYFFRVGNAALDFGSNTTHLLKDNYVENCFRAIAVYVNRTIDGLTAINMPNQYRLVSIEAAGAVVTLVDVCLHQSGAPSGGAIWASATNEYTLVLDHCSLQGGTHIVFSDALETRAQIHDTIIETTGTAVNLEAAQPVPAADRNVYFKRGGGTANFITENTTKSGLAAWQAFSGLDANSVEADPRWAGTLSAGDFALDPGSPAFTNGRDAGARKWRTQPNWAALTAQWDAGFYAHPTDEIGGSQLVVRG